jgi:hypothetical protein
MKKICIAEFSFMFNGQEQVHRRAFSTKDKAKRFVDEIKKNGSLMRITGFSSEIFSLDIDDRTNINLQ